MSHLSVLNILLNPRYPLIAPCLSPHRIPPIDQKSLDGTLKVYDITRVPALSLDRGIMAASIDRCVTSNYTEHSACTELILPVLHHTEVSTNYYFILTLQLRKRKHRDFK